GMAREAARFEQDDFPDGPRILFVGDATSSHVRSWIELLDNAHFNVRLFALPCAEATFPPADLPFRIYVGEPKFTECTDRRIPFNALGARLAAYEIRKKHFNGKRRTRFGQIDYAETLYRPWRRP